MRKAALKRADLHGSPVATPAEAGCEEEPAEDRLNARKWLGPSNGKQHKSMASPWQVRESPSSNCLFLVCENAAEVISGILRTPARDVLDSTLAELKAQGVPMKLAELAPARVPETPVQEPASTATTPDADAPAEFLMSDTLANIVKTAGNNDDERRRWGSAIEDLVNQLFDLTPGGKNGQADLAVLEPGQTGETPSTADGIPVNTGDDRVWGVRQMW